MRLFAFWGESLEMPHYRTREEYWHAQGWDQLAAEVRRRTIAELQKKGVTPNPESEIYKDTFNRLAGVYRAELVRTKRAKDKLERNWLVQHKDDTDEQLLAYLRTAVTNPEKQNTARGVVGGKYIIQRFGGWKKALVKAGLIEPNQQKKPDS